MTDAQTISTQAIGWRALSALFTEVKDVLHANTHKSYRFLNTSSLRTPCI